MSLLENFLAQCDELEVHLQGLQASDSSIQNDSSIEAEKEEIHDLWSEWKNAYKSCVGDPECNKKNKELLREKKKSAHTNYINCMATIGEWKAKTKPVQASTVQKGSSSLTVPPCDTQVFHGDYISWPSFRDLFTAIYVNNKKLSPVEKLYHLFQKTSGEAREINRNIPLTAEGFSIAWDNLKNQYENKRILINTQLRNLFNLTPCSQESAAGLKKLQRDITNCISILELYNIDIESWDPIFVYQCSTKMPKLTLSLWEQSLANKTEMPRWADLNKFLTERFHALESVSDIIGSSNLVQNSRPKYNHVERTKFGVHHAKVNNNKCSLCKGSHQLKSCPKFLSMNFKNRLSVVKREKRCLNCLAHGHQSAECRNIACSHCNLKHHTLLHKGTVGQQNSNEPGAHCGTITADVAQQIQSNNMPSTSTNVQAYHTSVLKKTMLATAWVNIIKDGLIYKIRALIDPGSDDSFISSRIQKILKLPIKSVAAEITGLGGEPLTKCSSVAFFTLGSAKMPSFSIDIDALVVQEVTGNIPTQSLEDLRPNHLPNLDLADPTFYKSGPIDLLIGGNLYPSILLKGVHHCILGSLVAQETVFGWVLTGPTNTSTPRRIISVSHCTRVSVSDQLTKFWEIEEVSRKPSVSEDDRICERIFQSSITRTAEGRYQVDLPFRSDVNPSSAFGSSRYIALCQFLRNEKSLARKPELKSAYDDVIAEYLALGHLEKVEPPRDNSDGYFYLPHHSVYRPESTTTKLRVVFNASCSSSNGKSLNDALYVGPVLQKDIIGLILNWRMYAYVFNADISKMYRQILVNPTHRSFQRILFRASLDEEVQDYQLNTVTFGVNCAPYLALRTLKQLADDEEHHFPIGSKILRDNMYVDDALVGIHSIEEGIRARDELIEILKSAGFHLRKGTSNVMDILAGIPKDHLLRDEFLEFDDKSCTKTLGIRWNASYDSFFFTSERIASKDSFTKREVLASIAKIFDPLGWICPVVIVAKVLMQSLWLDNIGWDDPLKPLSLLKWKTFIANQYGVDEIRIPRWVKYSPNCKIQVHGFCDSSELAYAAAMYLRVEVGENIYTNLLVSKSKVAPIKKVSLPRLELCGALLLAELADSVLPQLKFENSILVPWSDSMIVLAWLRKPSYTWTTFVANRVAIIQEKVGGNWRHVPTIENPADLATRGVTPLELKASTLWWEGPPWLKGPESYWPVNKLLPETSLESKPLKTHIARSTIEEDFLSRFSSLSRAVHVTAYIFRFFRKTHPITKKSVCFESKRLTAAELTFVRYRLMSLSQRMHFAREYASFDCKDF
ncbi:uncharacterized protein LOC142235663 [Haematobia irritans]|uniref:uncharacterized protein LOC142235663 n=1 Tax=Haematobia irritans TaxID=7368 RepID=UPI003F4F8481